LGVIDGGWDIDSKEKVIVGDGSVSVICMRPVIDSLWCGGENMIYVISPESLQTEVSCHTHPDVCVSVSLLVCLDTYPDSVIPT
jgi:hypothetical protein